jgi:Transmembrane domain of unknown function (DUF3566)
LDRRTNRPEGSGGASPTIVTSWAADDEDNDGETSASDISPAPPRRTPRTPAAGAVPTTTAPANGAVAASDASASDTATTPVTAIPSAVGPEEVSGQDEARGAEADITRTDIPALPADDIGLARGTRSAAKVSPATDIPATDVPPPGDAAASSAKPAAGDPPPPLAPGSSPFSPTSSGSTSSGSTSSGLAFSGSSLPGNRTPTVSPAAFAWEMSDPPPDSPSAQTESFLRAGTNATSAIPSRAAETTGPGAGRTAVGEDPKTLPRSGPKKAGSKKASSKRSARQAHLTVARVEPWSVMKFSFVVSLVAFVILFVAVSLLYGALDGLGVFDSLQRLVTSLTSSQSSAGVNASKWFSASRVLGYTALLGSLNIVLITAMATIGAVVYNLTSRLVGGVEVTLRETDE